MFEEFALIRYLKVKEYRKILKNITNFSLFQLTNYLVPLITIPYLVRVIGPEKFGIIAFAQSLILIFSVITDYGFNLSGVQLIAQQRNDQDKIRTTFSVILYIRILLMIFSFSVLIILILLIDEFRKDANIFILSFGLIPAEILISVYFFSGMEESQYLNYSNFIYRIGYIISIFIFVKNESDFYYVPFLNSIFMIVSGLISFYLVFKKFNIKIKRASFNDIIFYLKDGIYLFISNISIHFYRNSNIFFLGLVGTKEMVGFYSAAEKLIKVVHSAFVPITQAIYPYISRQKTESVEKAIKSIKMAIKILGISSAIVIIIIFIFAEPIIHIFLGHQFDKSISLIRIISPIILFSLMNNIIGLNIMLNFDMKKYFTYGVTSAGIFNVIVCLLMSKYLGEIGTAISLTVSDAFLFSLFVFYIIIQKKRGLMDIN